MASALPRELVYFFSNKLYLFTAYSILYFVIATGHTFAVAVAMPLVLLHAMFVQGIRKSLEIR